MGQEQKEYTWQLVAKMLAGEASEQELDELRQLLRSNPDLHYPLQTIAGLWSQSGPAEQKQAEEAFSRHLDRMASLSIDYDTTNPDATEAPRRRSPRRLLVAAAAVAILTISGFILYRPQPDKKAVIAQAATQTNEVTTRNGSRTSLYLPDGTRVWLNAASHIVYNKDFGKTDREVNLSGEAFFDVAHDPAKPFVIHAARIDIKVLGTSFNVKSYPADKTTETVLIRGSIEVAIRNRTNKKIILKPNEKLVIDNDDSATLRRHIATHLATSPAEHSPVTILRPTYEHTTGTMVETSWVDNKLIFQDMRFGNLAKDMERWYGVSIAFARPELEQLQFTGSFQQETIRQALDALRLTATFNYTISGNQINIYEK